MKSATTAERKPRKKWEPVDERLLAIAGQMFSDEGFSVGIDDILAESKVAKMSLYMKFGSKYELIRRLFEMCQQAWQKEIDRCMDDPNLQGLSKAIDCLTAVCALSRHRLKRTGLLFQGVVEFRKPSRKMSDTGTQRAEMQVECARRLRQLVDSLTGLCTAALLNQPGLRAQEFMVLAAGYFVMEPALGAEKSLQLVKTAAVTTFRGAVIVSAAAPLPPRPPRIRRVTA